VGETGSTEGTGAVDSQVTDQSSLVNSIPNPQQTAPRSDPTERVRQLQSMYDRSQQEVSNLKAELTTKNNDLAKAVLDRADLQRKLDQVTNDSNSSVESASRATQEAMDKAVRLEETNATLLADYRRLQVLVANPDVIKWKDLLDPNADIEILNRKVEAIRAARGDDQHEYREKVKSSPGPVNPAGVTPKKMAPEDIDTYLREAWGDAKLYEKRRQEVLAQMNS